MILNGTKPAFYRLLLLPIPLTYAMINKMAVK